MASLFDTGALERLRRGERGAEALAVRLYPPILCTHVAAEFLYGLAWVNVPAEAFLEAREFVESFEILTPSLSTASIYPGCGRQLGEAGGNYPTRTSGSPRTPSKIAYRWSPQILISRCLMKSPSTS